MPQSAPVIVLVHGRGEKQGEDEELALWREALGEVLNDDSDLDFARADLRMTYYADDLYPERQISLQSLDEETIAAQSAEDKVLLALFNEYAADLRRGEQPFVTSATIITPQGLGAEPTGAPGVPALRSPFPLPSIWTPEKYDPFVFDLLKYFALGYHEPINARLREQLDAAGDAPILLLSHSLGTVVAYDVLTTDPYRVDTWVTMGSPLAFAPDVMARLPAMIDRIPPDFWVDLGVAATNVQATVQNVQAAVQTGKKRVEEFLGLFRPQLRVEALSRRQSVHRLAPRRFPDRVARWYNIYDPADPVVNPPVIGGVSTLADKFLSDEQERVYDIAIRNGGGDAHSDTGYLNALHTTWLVKDFLLRHPVAKARTRRRQET